MNQLCLCRILKHSFKQIIQLENFSTVSICASSEYQRQIRRYIKVLFCLLIKTRAFQLQWCAIKFYFLRYDVGNRYLCSQATTQNLVTNLKRMDGNESGPPQLSTFFEASYCLPRDPMHPEPKFCQSNIPYGVESAIQ